MGKHVAIFLQQFTTKDGGSATAIELGDALRQLGHSVYFLPNRFTVKSVFVNIGNKIYPANYVHRPQSFSFTSLVKAVIYRLMKYKVESILRSAEFIVVPVVSLKDLNWIKARTAGKLMLNHAASVDMMKDSLSTQSMNYFEYCGLFDSVIFQSTVNCKASGLSNAVTLKPSFKSDKLSYIGEGNILDPRRINIVWVGSLQARKRPDLAIDTLKILLKRNPKYKLTIVGPSYDPGYFQYISQYASTIEGDSIDIVGYRKNYLQYIREADFVLQTSEKEGVSRIVRESFCLQKVVATFMIEGTSEICNPRNSILAEFGDVISLAEQIDCVQLDLTVKNHLSEAAKSTFDNHYSWNNYLETIAKIFC